MNQATQQFQTFLRGEPISQGWGHQDLIRMAAVACQQHPGQEVDYIRQGLMAINARFMKPGHEGYHHTLTCLWIDLVKLWLDQKGPTSSDPWGDLDQAYYDSRIPLQFYSQRHLDRPEAKVEYLQPDLAPIRLPGLLEPELAQLWRRFCLAQLGPDSWDELLQTRLRQAAQQLYGVQAFQVLAAGVKKLRAKHPEFQFDFEPQIAQ